MATVEKSIDVPVPVSVAYGSGRSSRSSRGSWKASRRSGGSTNAHVHWVAEIGGQRHEWDAEIESRQRRTDDWRGRVGSGRVTDDDPTR